jgi:DNA-binding FadR family transcriptional regulator
MQVAQAIRVYIAERSLQPGDRVGTEHDLAAEFGVSRPTVREALRLLAGSHLIRASQGRSGGIFVASMPHVGMATNIGESIVAMLATERLSLHDMVEARMFLEVPLAGMAAEKADAATVADLEAAIDAQRGHLPGTPPFNDADTRFHRILAEASGNDLLMAFTRWILDVLQPSLIDVISASVGPDEIIEQHTAILRGVRRGQRAAAERAMRRHLEYLEETLVDIESREGPS